MSKELVDAIVRSRGMLDWPDNWDGEGSKRYLLATWDRAIHFLYDNSEVIAAPPIISPAAEGSIDLHWKLPHATLLINIPEDTSEAATFYGDNDMDQLVKGNLNTSGDNQWLMLWLMSRS
jgi:hypothetical protein